MSSAAEAPDDARKAERRRDILDAAFEEFVARGYAGASMEAIARRARASKETLYAWFGNKERLFDTLFADRMDQMTSRVTAVAQADPSPAAVLAAIAEDAIRFTLAIAPLGQAVGVGQPSEGARRLIGQSIARERANFVDYLKRLRAEGRIAFDDDPFELASLFVAMAQGEWRLRLDTGLTTELTEPMIREHARRVTRIFLKGLSPER
ncbi:MAG TPA: TetR/AcrR family transcriptional regulator [Caulobacteraceae bacterium]|nr:TetR/AcrR family transcriptional regulator [Caulobacteraceae bacterium]